LFGTNDGNQLDGYSSVGINKKNGSFAKIEKNGWTGIAFVNTVNSPATVTLTAYDDDGNSIAVQTISLKAYEKVVNYAEKIFTKDIGNATYISFSSDKELVGFQLNGSSDEKMMDALPGM